ncbi:MAG: hypothetical protein B1H08_02455 [Candidatus Omnitrophica bacterium 4484_171]|nr:MAG: hypothetical protein B1H08_02455 [Candidatus Omnitrophica bacterium 4484_171]
MQSSIAPHLLFILYFVFLTIQLQLPGEDAEYTFPENKKETAAKKHKISKFNPICPSPLLLDISFFQIRIVKSLIPKKILKIYLLINIILCC